jgi:hypothetical protein
MFKALNKIGYEAYLEKFPFHEDLGIDLSLYKRQHKDLNRKIKASIYEYTDVKNFTPYPAELDDLIRLHYLVTSRKVTTILEFGVGLSTKVFDHALTINKDLYSDYVGGNLKIDNPFVCHSVDTSKKWIKMNKNKYKPKRVIYYHSKCITTTFSGRICTMYKKLPNICPDFIYLDGPDQYSVTGNIRGISTRHINRLPMAGDLLAMEHFLVPGTLIVVDGRTANARFLKTNFQRNWKYHYFKNYDQHFFELDEIPLGVLNERQINFKYIKF